MDKKDSKSDDCIANGSLSINLPNVDAFNDLDGKAQQITSKVEKIGGLTWQMKVRKVLKPNRLNVYVHCNKAVKDRLWMCKVEFKVEMWTSGDGDGLEIKSDYFGFNSHFWIYPIEFYLPKEGSIEIKLEIKVCKVLEKSLPALDTSLVVNMGEGHSETLFVNKYAMATLSNYFRNLFFEDWRDKREKDGNMFELYEPQDFDIRAFKAMIYSAMTLGSCWTVQESNFLDYELAVEIVKLAIKFDFPMLHDCCEQFLIDNSDHAQTAMALSEFGNHHFNRRMCEIYFGPMLLLAFADKFNLVKLKEHCLEKMSILDFVNFWLAGMGLEEMDKKREILLSRLSKATREELLIKMDQKFASNDYGDRSRMEVLEVADHFNLTKLKQHCLDKLNVLDYMRSSCDSHEITSRLSKATQKQLHAKLSGKACDLYHQTEELQYEFHRVYRPDEHVLVEQFDKLAGALLDEE